MPICMLLGALLCHPISAFDAWLNNATTPILVSLMLFVTFCSVDARNMRPTMLHLWLVVVQIVGCVVVYLLLRPFGEVLAQGGMICVLMPIAMGSVVIGGMLGARVETLATHCLVCNLATALLAPVILSYTGTGECTLWQILGRIAPMLIVPFIAGQACRHYVKPVAQWVARHGQISFYLWLASLLILIGRTTHFIIQSGTKELGTEVALAIVALVICLAQFIVGKRIGRRYGEPVSGGQALGQKNTVLSVWMAQSFLSPLACVAPTAYIVWQNIVNSYQLYKKRG